MTKTTGPRTYTDTEIDALDPLTALPITTVKGSALREGMVLVDPDFDTPVALLDHRVRSEGRGTIRWMLADLEAGGWIYATFTGNQTVRVAARIPAS